MNIEKMKEFCSATEELERTRQNYSLAAGFVSEYRDFFEEKESLEALKRISKWAKKKRNEDEAMRQAWYKKKLEIIDCCEHEIAVRYPHRNKFECLMCDEETDPNKAILVIDGIDACYHIQELKHTFIRAILEDKNPYDAIEEKIKEMEESPYSQEEDIIVRRKK